MNKHYLLPGKIFAATEPTEITTILGSCVSVAIYDNRKKIGGLNHYLLADGPAGATLSSRYGVTAIEELIQALIGRGGQVGDFSAKIYGGANVRQKKISKCSFRTGRKFLGTY